MSFHPQTPQSPSHFSPITTDSLSGASSSVSGVTTSNSFNNNYASGNSFSSAATSTTLLTPAHSVNESGTGPSDTAHDMSSSENSPQKRKRDFDDAGEHAPKKVHVAGQQKMDFDALHEDVGEKYLLCKTPHKPAFPPTSGDLFAMFDLTDTAAHVARTLPNGEKNAMRKTYKGYMKKLGISGHFEPQKREEGDESDFKHLVSEADDSWMARQVKTKDIRDGLADDVEANLRRALTMNKGPILKAVWDSSVLGDLAPEKLLSLGSKPSSVRGLGPSTPLHPSAVRPKIVLQQQPQSSTSGPDSARPRRVNKKRSYGDNSFEGYAESFPDDDAGADGGYSTGEGEGPSHKRRKKNSTPSGQYPGAPVRQQSYGPGMVGA